MQIHVDPARPCYLGHYNKHVMANSPTCHPERSRGIFLFVLMLSLLTACGGGGTAVRYYLVDPITYSAASIRTDNQIAIEILDIQVPQYLERFHIATRRQANQLHFADNNQWGENLRKNLLRTLARNLSVLLGSNDVGTPLNRSMSLPDYRIQVHIEQFERDSDGIVRLIARWQVSGQQSNATPITLKADLQGGSRIAEADFDRIVAEMQQLFGQLSQRIAESISATANAASGAGGT